MSKEKNDDAAPIDDPRENVFDLDSFDYEEEGLFSRDIDGQLVRLVETTAADYDTDVTITIDGQEVTVKKAVPLTDSQGNIVNDKDGKTIPRATTIYDAATKLFVKKPGDEHPIPTLCHREHMAPAGVCRVCVVEVFRTSRGQRRAGSKLVPACHHRVEPGMEIQTIGSKAGNRVRSAVKVLTELMVADHLKPAALTDSAPDRAVPNELQALAKRLNIKHSRFQRGLKQAGQDDSSLQIAVDHDACILCERCVRGCNQIKQNSVIGRTGKGYATRIGFDLDDPMKKSSCVSCGECMISCPTDALIFRSQVQPDRPLEKGESAVTVEELLAVPMFSGVPYKFLQWNSKSVIRQTLEKGDVLCKEGEYGREAFLLTRGEFEVSLRSAITSVKKEKKKGLWGWLGQVTNQLGDNDTAGGRSIGGDSSAALSYQRKRVTLTPEDVILGEMTCMSHYPRSATVVAASDAEVLKINRNVLYMLQRNAAARRILDDVYRQRALQNHLRTLALFQKFNEAERQDCIEFLRDKVELGRADPGQVIFRQGEQADHFYMVRLGFVKVTRNYGSQQRVVAYLRPGNHFGEIGLLSQLSQELADQMPAGFVGRRTATCAALDNLEYVRIRGDHFRELWNRFPKLREPFVEYARNVLEQNQQEETEAYELQLPEFLDQGLFNAQRLLVLDLESCTRCDECTKACSDTHGGVTRLIREGLRFDKYLVASSCRSCLDPYCLVGCPVDSIHREGSLEIVIEDHCIGCGQCAQNCPYGNINMHGFPTRRDDPANPGTKIAVVQQKATTCDLCRDIVTANQDPSCVYACPHDAAFRMSGKHLLSIVQDAK